ncbi:hypothetical protein G5I_09822 [Acromyrmex echinatior]|uniref:Uncharacterized protein n=1 Tax=Acromyrmex echinatior TaxID=103372 RepID=F4WV31_ACREC|nr:hypothetical protein G5I_09822 [Acromyrmex echinatior]
MFYRSMLNCVNALEGHIPPAESAALMVAEEKPHPDSLIMNAPIPLPLLLTTSSLSLETQLYEIITESSKACAAFLRHSLRRATSLGWTATESFETSANGVMYNEQ